MKITESMHVFKPSSIKLKRWHILQTVYDVDLPLKIQMYYDVFIWQMSLWRL